MQSLSWNFFDVKSKRKCFVPALIALATIFGSATSHATPISKRTAANPTRIMALGDSITEGKYGDSKTGGYRGNLQTLLYYGGYYVNFVGKEDDGTPANATEFSYNMLSGQQKNHEGYGSYRIDQIANGVPLSSIPPENHSALPIEQTIANNNPDVILMMLGTNDTLQSYFSPDKVGFNGQSSWEAQAAQRLNVLINRVFTAKPTVKLVVAKIPPFYNSKSTDPWWYNNYMVKPYNYIIPQVVAQYQNWGYNIVMVDQWSGMNIPTDFTSEDVGYVHPNDVGFQKMAQVLYNGLTSATPIVSGGTYNLVNPNSLGKVATVDGWATDNFSKVNIWDYLNQANQLWTMNFNSNDGTYTIVSVSSGKALNDIGWCTGGPCATQIYQPTGGDNERWYVKSNRTSSNLDDTYTLVNKYSNLALDVNASSSVNGALVQQYSQNGGGAQKWMLRQMN